MNFEAKCELLKNLIEDIQCSKCEAVPGFDDKSRFRFHCLATLKVLCEDCKNKHECLTCKDVQERHFGVVEKTPSPVIEKLLKDMPCFCPHYAQGCREIFAKSEDLNDHETTCIFRLVPCLLDHGCREFPFKDYKIEHLTQDHKIEHLTQDLKSTKSVMISHNKFEVVFNFNDEDSMEDEPEFMLDNGTWWNPFELNGMFSHL